MDFAEIRAAAFDETKRKLQRTLEPDQVIIHCYRVLTERPNALAHWLHAVLPQYDPEEARKKVAELGEKAWDPQHHGADMHPEGWEMLQYACIGKEPQIEVLAVEYVPNLNTLLGTMPAAQLLDAAGSLDKLARMSQRECTLLGNESGKFGAHNTPSLLEKHELATNDRALRVLCSRAVLAARLDRFKGIYKGESLREEVYYAQ